MHFEEYRAMDATALAQAIRDKHTTPAEILQVAQKRLAAVNPKINAVILDLDKSANEQIDVGLPKGPFTGVPFLVKDMDGLLANHRATSGSRSLANYVPDHDSELFARYRKSGVVFMGKTNCPEFGIMGITEPELHGPTRNPWNRDFTPGGSSGGSAAAVAAGVVPVAHAGDGGGSIRIPAAMCGLFGLKPSRGRMPLGPDISEGWDGFVVPHVVSRSVRDSAAFLAATHGPDLGAPYGEPHGSTRFVEAVSRAPKPLKIGFTSGAIMGLQMHSDCLNAVHDTVELLEDLGHEVSPVELPIDADEMAMAYLTVVAAGTATAVAGTEALTGQKPRPELFERPTWFLNEIGQVLSARELEQAKIAIGAATRRIARLFSDIDVYVSATAAFPPSRIGELQMSPLEKVSLSALRRLSSFTGPTADPVYRQALKQLSGDSLAKTPNTQIFNMTGQPAMSVPLSTSKEGLPIGVQFAGRYGQEVQLLQLAGQLEQARPWFDKVPVI
jgi:amidase